MAGSGQDSPHPAGGVSVAPLSPLSGPPGASRESSVPRACDRRRGPDPGSGPPLSLSLSVSISVRHLSGVLPAGIGTLPQAGCQGFTGPVPPPFWIAHYGTDKDLRDPSLGAAAAVVNGGPGLTLCHAHIPAHPE